MHAEIVVDVAHRCAVKEAPDEALISWFLSNGADPNAMCEMDFTPLSTAVGYGPLPIVKQLFAHCPQRVRLHGYLLHWAARRQSDDAVEVVQLVLERCRPDVNEIFHGDDGYGFPMLCASGLGTALHEAAKEGRSDVVQLLIREGTDLSKRDTLGKTALEVAEFFQNHAAVELLRSAEKNVAAKM